MAARYLFRIWSSGKSVIADLKVAGLNSEGDEFAGDGESRSNGSRQRAATSEHACRRGDRNPPPHPASVAPNAGEERIKLIAIKVDAKTMMARVRGEVARITHKCLTDFCITVVLPVIGA